MSESPTEDPRSAWQRSRGFLSTWERPIGSPRVSIEECRGAGVLTARELCAAANLVSLHLARAGRPGDAQELLDVQVAASAVAPDVLVWTLDARVNLARLDVLRRQPVRAMDRYRQLRELVAWEHDDTGLEFGRRELRDSAPDQIELVQALRALRNGLAGDLCRLHWRSGQLSQLVELARDFRRRWPTASGAGRAFPVEAMLLVDVESHQESLPDDEPEDLVVRVLHHASYEVAHARESAASMVTWAEECVDGHLASCAGCSSCVDWLIDLAMTESAAGRDAVERWESAVRMATTLADHAGLTRLAALVGPALRTGVEATLATISPDDQLLDAARVDLVRRIEELAA